jgi:hypothetical protein
MSTTTGITLTRAQRRAAEKADKITKSAMMENADSFVNNTSNSSNTVGASKVNPDEPRDPMDPSDSIMDLSCKSFSSVITQDIKSPPPYTTNSEGIDSLLNFGQSQKDTTPPIQATSAQLQPTPENRNNPALTGQMPKTQTSLEDLLGPISLLLNRNPHLPASMTSTPDKTVTTAKETDATMSQHTIDDDQDVSNSDILSALKSSVTKLTYSIDDVRTDLTAIFNLAIDDIRLKLTYSLRGFEERITSVENDMIKRHDDLVKTMNSKVDDLTEITRAANDLSNSKIKNLQDTVTSQQTQISELLEQLKMGDLSARKAAKDAIIAANATEGHNRRWALRILGLPGPVNNENTLQAKQIAERFFADKLQSETISAIDIDCAHRVGKKDKNGKQTLLVRLFERDNVEALLSKKKNLKGSGFILYEDATYLDRRLITALKDHPNVSSAWMHHGTIWARHIGAGDKEKTKVQILDDLDILFP